MSWITHTLFLLGSISMLLAAIGLLRFPDFYTRCHAGTKAASLGAGLILIGALVPIDDPDIAIRIWLTILFIFLTIPVAGHLLGRAAFLRTHKQWPNDHFEDWNKNNRDQK
jgi:multicomponent Na+:H+ antiporter subunit G